VEYHKAIIACPAHYTSIFHKKLVLYASVIVACLYWKKNSLTCQSYKQICELICKGCPPVSLLRDQWFCWLRSITSHSCGRALILGIEINITRGSTSISFNVFSLEFLDYISTYNSYQHLSQVTSSNIVTCNLILDVICTK
jgi:hypothetical protein